MQHYTPSETKILQVLSDGKIHTKKELRDALGYDEQDSNGTIRVHVHKVRRKLEKVGQTIICEYRNRQLFYRHVIKLLPDE